MMKEVALSLAMGAPLTALALAFAPPIAVYTVAALILVPALGIMAFAGTVFAFYFATGLRAALRGHP